MDLSKVKQKFSYKVFGIGGETELEIERSARSELKRGTTGVDYSRLRKFLEKGDWQAADKETWEVMCRVAARENEGWLDEASILNFPCEDLQQINQLWEHYSKGKFGFRVQKKIYENRGGGKTSRSESAVWKAFCEYVGWQKEGSSSWVWYSDLTFNLKNAPQGHLPRECFGHLPKEIMWMGQIWGVGCGKNNGGEYMMELVGVGLFSRVKTCNL